MDTCHRPLFLHTKARIKRPEYDDPTFDLIAPDSDEPVTAMYVEVGHKRTSDLSTLRIGITGTPSTTLWERCDVAAEDLEERLLEMIRPRVDSEYLLRARSFECALVIVTPQPAVATWLRSIYNRPDSGPLGDYIRSVLGPRVHDILVVSQTE